MAEEDEEHLRLTGSAGAPANFVLLSWLNALYSFDYKWSLTNRSLQERMHFFEHHWAFFAGGWPALGLAEKHCLEVSRQATQ